MIRVFLAAALLTPTLTFAAPRTSPATACSVGPPMLGEVVPGADFIALVDIISVGSRENAQPTLSPQPTLTPTASPHLRTPPPTVAPAEPTSTPYPDPPVFAREPVDLTGIGARARIVAGYFGQSAGEIDLDAATRLEVEIAAREVESFPPGVISPCPVTILAARFEPGSRYLVNASEGGRRVTWYTLVKGVGDAATVDAYFMLPRATYDRFFPPAPPEYYADDGSAVDLQRENLPLETMIAIIADLRGDRIILPPQTGTAGIR